MPGKGPFFTLPSPAESEDENSLIIELNEAEEQLRDQFLRMRNAKELAILLDIDYERLNYHLYISDPSMRYTKFSIPKSTGGRREISAPITALKLLQRKLADILTNVYRPKSCVHGFAKERSIVTNAGRHARKRYVFNLDLKDFFPSINFGRVRGMFSAVPYSLDLGLATVLAQICCFDNQLPQGAPTSPIVSNMICAKMDSQLRRLAQRHRCMYTRYADDMTFSNSMPVFPPQLAKTLSSGQVEVGEELARIISENGFQINDSKVRMQSRNVRQEVTGLTVNKFPNITRRRVRRVRAMLHAWRRFGLEAAEQEFLARYDKKHRGPHKEPPSFKGVVKGNIEFIGMVRGKHNPTMYKSLLAQYAELDPSFVLPDYAEAASLGSAMVPLVFTEGTSDWKHLKNALEKLKAYGRVRQLEVEFHEYSEAEDGGSDPLVDMCRSLSRRPQARPTFMVFDRDEPKILSKVAEDSSLCGIKNWGNNVFSFALPIPPHRRNCKQITIELYYTDEEIKRTDEFGRRLFLSSEFEPKSGRHLQEPLNCTLRNKLGGPEVRVIDADVYDGSYANIALPKNYFAKHVLEGHANFNDFDVTAFEEVFRAISATTGLAL